MIVVHFILYCQIFLSAQARQWDKRKSRLRRVFCLPLTVALLVLQRAWAQVCQLLSNFTFLPTFFTLFIIFAFLSLFPPLTFLFSSSQHSPLSLSFSLTFFFSNIHFSHSVFSALFSLSLLFQYSLFSHSLSFQHSLSFTHSFFFT